MLCANCRNELDISKYVGGTEVRCVCGAPHIVPYRGANIDWSTLPGKTIGGCLVESKLGQGGIGVVFKGTHLNLKTPVAIKILSPTLTSNPDHVERFRREAQLTASFQHPNIVTVLNVGMEMGLYYIVMQYIHGRTVQDILNEKGYLSWKKAVTIAKEAAKGLKDAHQKGIIHRDIKPDNIMITLDKGQVKITDFGLARTIEVDKSLTHTGQVLGTPYFMSPEQCQGKTVDQKADIYSLGATLFYMLTGQKPFDGDSYLDICLKHINEPLPNPSKIRQDNVPPILVKIINKMMAKKPEQRYANCDLLIEDLSKVQHGDETSVWAADTRFITKKEVMLKQSAKEISTPSILTPSTLKKVSVGSQENTVSRPPSQSKTASAVSKENQNRKVTRTLPQPANQPATAPVKALAQPIKSAKSSSKMTWILFGGLLVLVLGLGSIVLLKPVLFPEKDRYQEYLDRGITLFGEKKFQEAQDFFTRAQQQKDTPEIQKELISTRLAILRDQVGKAELNADWEQMKSLYERIAAIQPEDPMVLPGRKLAQYQIFFLKGKEALQEEDFEEAMLQFSAAYGIFPKDEVQALLQKTEIVKMLAEIRRFEEQDLQKAIEQLKNFIQQKEQIILEIEKPTLNQVKQKLESLLQKEKLLKIDFKILLAKHREDWELAATLYKERQKLLPSGEGMSGEEQLVLFRKSLRETETLFFKEKNWNNILKMFDQGLDSLLQTPNSSLQEKSFATILKEYSKIRKEIKDGLGTISEQLLELIEMVNNFFEENHFYKDILWFLNDLTEIIEKSTTSQKEKDLIAKKFGDLVKKIRMEQIESTLALSAQQKQYYRYRTLFEVNKEELKALFPKEKIKEESNRNFDILQKIASFPSEMFLIESGIFEMGDDQEGQDFYPRHRVQMQSFLMDCHEVTVEEYQKFLETKPKIKHPDEPESYNRIPEQWEEQQKKLQLPVVGVNWYDAYAYATWAQKQLPTEAQFSYALARLKEVPRGDFPENIATGELLSYKKQEEQVRKTPFPLQDLAGNGAEWCQDYYKADFYRQGLEGISMDPENTIKSPLRVARGSSFQTKRDLSTRIPLDPLTRQKDVGFRCVRLLK
ncbi:MAG: protein kinase [Planctomycetota bacterium]